MELTSENWQWYAVKNYHKPKILSQAQFDEDLRKLDFKANLTRFQNSKEPKLLRLIVNNVIICINTFGYAAVNLILFKLNGCPKHTEIIKHIFLILGLLNTIDNKDAKLENMIITSLGLQK